MMWRRISKCPSPQLRLRKIPNKHENADDAEDFRIGIVTGSFSQSGDDRRGAEAFQKKYGPDKVALAIYPDNFTDEAETTIGVMTGLTDDPTTEVGVPGAQEYITEHVPDWVKKYGQNSAYYCTNDAHTEPLIKGFLENGGYYIEAEWNGAKYINAETGEAFDNIFLVYQDTYIFGDPGRYMDVTKISVPEAYYTIK